MKPTFVLATIGALVLAGCNTARPPQPPVAQVAAGPSVDILAPSARVRQVIAQRAQQRGAGVLSNDARGVILERELPQTSPVLEASCGSHQPGRRIRIELRTAEAPGRTEVTERRIVLDQGKPCIVQLNEADIEEANRSLNELKQQVESGALARR
jgi:hypothetical protein